MGEGWLLALTLLLSTACGTLGNTDPLPDNWPRTPLIGFTLRDDNSPFALLRLGWDLDQPAVAPHVDDPAVPLTVWGVMSPRQTPTQSVLFCAPVTDLGAALPPYHPALAPVAAWEGVGLRSPAWLAGDADLPPLLFYQGSDGSVGLAKSIGDCAVQRLTTTAPLVPASVLASGQVGRISVLRTGDKVRMYYLVDGQQAHFAETDVVTLQRRAAGEEVALTFAVSPVVLSATDFVVKESAVTTVPAERLDGIYVRRMTTPLGRDRFDLYALASAMSTSVVVSAASYTGGSLTAGADRFLPELVAALSTSAGVPKSPTVVTYNGQPLLLLGLKSVQTGIAAAVHCRRRRNGRFFRSPFYFAGWCRPRLPRGGAVVRARWRRAFGGGGGGRRPDLV